MCWAAPCEYWGKLRVRIHRQRNTGRSGSVPERIASTLPHGEPEGAPPGFRAVYFANGEIMKLNKSEFYPHPEKHDGVLSAVIAGFVAGVTATITMLKLVR